jgi:hypothetical protein
MDKSFKDKLESAEKYAVSHFQYKKHVLIIKKYIKDLKHNNLFYCIKLYF